MTFFRIIWRAVKFITITRAIFYLAASPLLFACGTGPQAADFQVGMSRQAVVAAFGEPDQRQTMVKSGPHIFGPIETFWTSVPAGATVEIWSYEVSGGSVELYFVNGSDEIQGTGFAPEGAIY